MVYPRIHLSKYICIFVGSTRRQRPADERTKSDEEANIFNLLQLSETLCKFPIKFVLYYSRHTRSIIIIEFLSITSISVINAILFSTLPFVSSHSAFSALLAFRRFFNSLLHRNIATTAVAGIVFGVRNLLFFLPQVE